MKALLLDTETTGLVKPVGVEIAYSSVDFNATGGLMGAPAFEQRFNPGKRISFGATGAHHITNDDVAMCPHIDTFQLPHCEYLIGHNIDFDWDVLGRPNVKRVCTLVLSRALWADDEGHSLSAMMYRLEPERAAQLTRGAHGAAADVAMNFLLLGHIVKRLKCTSLEALYAESEAARIPKVMTFGKHRGLPVAAVPHDYRMWYRRQNDPPPDPYLLKAWGLA